MIRKKILMAAIPLFVISGADAAVSLDRTRAVFDGSEKSMTLDISNDNKQLPYLAQAWIEMKIRKNYYRAGYCHPSGSAP
ncbi:chaperone protein PapD [Escherichia coli]|nr:chaperone protein PapD [Escherichia coli]